MERPLSRYSLFHGDALAELAALPSDSLDSLVTDPPAGIAFMGKAWDEDHGGRGEWVEAFGAIFRECLRVLKPGAHGLVWALPRTAHWTATALEDAGFEVRDVILHLFGTGFPKSLDVSKAIDAQDRADASRARALRFTAWMRDSGLTAREINDATASNMGSHLLTDKTQPEVATAEIFDALRPILASRRVEIPAWVEEMVEERTTESANLKARKVTGARLGHDLSRSKMAALAAQDGAPEVTPSRMVERTAPHTPEAQAWEGWGTALKPAAEHWILVRKPLGRKDGHPRTVAQAVLGYGTGALNIDGCRIESPDLPEDRARHGGGTKDGPMAERYAGDSRHDLPPGRWPANVTLGEGEWDAGGLPSRFFYCAKPSRAERDAGCAGLSVKSGGEATGRADGTDGLRSPRAGAGRGGGARNHHPTVKAVALMRWLVRLVTPPGGTVLDPFTGSGSTGVACMHEGMRFVGIEQDAGYLCVARARIGYAARGVEGEAGAA